MDTYVAHHTPARVEFYNTWVRAVQARKDLSVVDILLEAEIWQALERKFLEVESKGDVVSTQFLLDTAVELADMVWRKAQR